MLWRFCIESPQHRTTVRVIRMLTLAHPFATMWHFTHREACHWIRGSLLSPMNPVPLPPQGETRNLRRKTESHILHVPVRHSPFGGWRHHLVRWEACLWILSRLRLPANPVPFPPQAGHYKSPLCYELLMKGLLCESLLSTVHILHRMCKSGEVRRLACP